MSYASSNSPSRYSTSFKLLITAFTLCLFLRVFPSLVYAQVLYGSLTGNITDPSGAAVPNAKVEARETSKGVVQVTTTDASGIYRFSALLPGTYDITISESNFSTLLTKAVNVTANAARRLDAQLQINKVQESVTVTDQSPDLQTDRADVHTELEQKVIESLPAISSEGKSFQALYKIIPGASPPIENNSSAGNPQRAMTTNVNGQSNQANNT